MKLSIALSDIFKFVNNASTISVYYYTDNNESISYFKIHASVDENELINEIHHDFLSKGNKIFLVPRFLIASTVPGVERYSIMIAKDKEEATKIYQAINKTEENPSMIAEIEFTEILKRYELVWYNYIAQTDVCTFILAKDDEDARDIAIKYIISRVGQDESFAEDSISYLDEFTGFHDITREKVGGA